MPGIEAPIQSTILHATLASVSQQADHAREIGKAKSRRVNRPIAMARALDRLRCRSAIRLGLRPALGRKLIELCLIPGASKLVEILGKCFLLFLELLELLIPVGIKYRIAT